MDSNKFYVPNVHKWIKYYQERRNDPYIQSGYQRKQVGGSLSGAEGSFMVPIDDRSPAINQSNPVELKLVSPSQQVVEQAKAELEMVRKGTKRKTSNKSVSRQKKRRTVKTTKKKVVKRLKKNIKSFRKRKYPKPQKSKKTLKKKRRARNFVGKDIFST